MLKREAASRELASPPPRLLARRKTFVVIKELDLFATSTAIDIERKNPFIRIGPFAEQQMPAARGTADANRNLPKRLHRAVADGTLHVRPLLQ